MTALNDMYDKSLSMFLPSRHLYSLWFHLSRKGIASIDISIMTVIEIGGWGNFTFNRGILQICIIVKANNQIFFFFFSRTLSLDVDIGCGSCNAQRLLVVGVEGGTWFEQS